jgi:hypothetical protein
MAAAERGDGGGGGTGEASCLSLERRPASLWRGVLPLFGEASCLSLERRPASLWRGMMGSW